MKSSYITIDQRQQWSAAVRAGAFVVLALFSFQAFAQAEEEAEPARKPLVIYMYKEDGMSVYSNRKPVGIDYSVVRPGAGAPRPVLSIPPTEFAKALPAKEIKQDMVGWAASCQGVSKEVLDKRAAPLQGYVSKHSKAHGVPAELVRAVIRVESCFNPRAVSRVGARGLMQLMPATATHLGVRDSFDAEQNIAGGARYLSELLARFKNDTHLAVAAYNAGPTAVDNYRGIPPFPETRSYVKRVIAEYRQNSHAPAKKSKS